MEIALTLVPEVSDVPVMELDWYSPNAPAGALSLVVVPTIPAVLGGVMLPVTDRFPESDSVRICEL